MVLILKAILARVLKKAWVQFDRGLSAVHGGYLAWAEAWEEFAGPRPDVEDHAGAFLEELGKWAWHVDGHIFA